MFCMHFLELGKLQRDHESSSLIKQEEAGESSSGASTIKRIAKELTEEEIEADESYESVDLSKFHLVVLINST